MNDEEQHDARSCDEMDSARGLSAAEHVDQKWECGVHSRRHGEAREEHERQKDQGHQEVGELLEYVVAFCLFSLRKSKSHMLGNRRADMLQLFGRWRQIDRKSTRLNSSH